MPNAHPAIIDPEVFRAVKEKAQSRVRGNGLPSTPKRALYLLSGKMTCGACGEHYTHHGATEVERVDGSKRQSPR